MSKSKPVILARIPEGCFEIWEVFQSVLSSNSSRVPYTLHGWFSCTKEEIEKYVCGLNERLYPRKYPPDSSRIQRNDPTTVYGDPRRYRHRHKACIELNGKFHIVNLNPITLKDLHDKQEQNREASEEDNRSESQEPDFDIPF